MPSYANRLALTPPGNTTPSRTLFDIDSLIEEKSPNNSNKKNAPRTDKRKGPVSRLVGTNGLAHSQINALIFRL
jgi:hypothetical protein